MVLLPHFSGLLVGMASFYRGTFTSHQRMCVSKIGVHQNIKNQEVLLENNSSKPMIGEHQAFQVISLNESCHQSILPILILAGHRIICSSYLQQNHNFETQTEAHK